ncbi:hypothetical protein SK128_003691, partial [Halocaridina rubra]
RTLSGEQYSMTMLGRRRASTTRELLYTSLLPSTGPTKLSYQAQPNGGLGGQIVPYHSSNAANIIWTDLDGAPLTVHRKSSHLGYDFGDLEIPSLQRHQLRSEFDDEDVPPPRRRSSAFNEYDDYDMGNFIYRRPTREERDDYGGNYRAVIPLQPVIVEDEDYVAPVSSLCRSDTVANLLTKYSNFSLNREFGYHAPQSAYSRHIGKTREFLSTIPDIREDEPSPVSDRNMTLVPLPQADSDLGPVRLSNSRDRSHSLTPGRISAGHEIPVYPREPSRDISRGRETSFTSRDDFRSREESYIPVSRKRLSDIQEDVREPPRPRSGLKEEKRPSPVLEDVPDYLMQSPEQMGPRGRPGGALQRYRERKARESLGIFEHPDYSTYYVESNGESEPPLSKPSDLPRRPESHASSHQDQHEDDTIRRASHSRQSHSHEIPHTCPDPYHQRMRDKYTQESQSRTAQEQYGRSEEQFSRASFDPYGPATHGTNKRQTNQDPHWQPQSRSYGYDMDDHYGRISSEPYARRSQDSYNRISQGSYGRPPPAPYRQDLESDEDIRERPFRLRTRLAPQQDYDTQEHGGSYSRNRNYSSQISDDYESGYGGGYGNVSSYGSRRSTTTNFDDYDALLNNGSQSTLSRIEIAASKYMSDRDEAQVHGGRSLTPREEERLAIGKLASKYLKPKTMRDFDIEDGE